MEKKVTAPANGRSFGQTLKAGIADNTSVVILLILLCLCVFFVTGFATGSTIVQLVLEISMYGLVAVGLSLVMMAGSIDLSVGYLMGCAAVAVVTVYNATGSVLASVVVGLLVGLALGAVNGFFVTVIGINPMIATIALCYIYNGIVLRSTNEGSVRAADNHLRDVIYSTGIGGVSLLNVTVIVFVLVIVALGVFLRKTTMGNNLFISGGNADAGRLSGVDPKKYLFAAYVLCGLCCALAGLFLSARFNGASYSLGAGRDVFAISACVIGGIKMSGGSGTMTKALIGIIIMRLISTAMNCMLIPTAWTDFVSGALLLVILIFGRLSTGFDSDL